MRPTQAACQATWVGLAVLNLLGMRNGRAGYIPGAQRPAGSNPLEEREREKPPRRARRLLRKGYLRPSLPYPEVNQAARDLAHLMTCPT